VTPLLGAHEPHPVTVLRETGRSAFFLTCDHAANRIPESLGTLGLEAGELRRHIAWDIGAAGVSRRLAEQLDSTLVVQNYSRLVVDCNRPRDSEQLIPRHSEATGVPGNQVLDEAARRRRIEAIYRPYHDTITDLLDRRAQRRPPTVFVAVHSFTPVYLGLQRPWHIGILYGRDRRMAVPILEQLEADGGLCVGDNQPYRIDHKDYGIPVHGEGRGLPHLLFEIRQDLIATDREQRAWATRLAGLLTGAVAAMPSAS
jgi:predicted N-formylglutamate amidohydrolase